MVRAYNRKVRPATGRQEIQTLSMKDRRTKIAFALGSLLFIVLALNRLCAAIVLPGSRSAIASSAHYDDIEMLQRQLIQGGLSVRPLIAQFIERIHALDQAGPAIHSVIELNPDALSPVCSVGELILSFNCGEIVNCDGTNRRTRELRRSGQMPSKPRFSPMTGRRK